MASPAEILAAISDLGEIFGDPPTGRGLALYGDALADLPAEVLRMAVTELIRHRCRYFPTPGEIRAAISDESVLALPAPYHQPFPDDDDHRSLEEIAATRRSHASLWGEVRRMANGGELRPFSEALAECGLTIPLPTLKER